MGSEIHAFTSQVLPRLHAAEVAFRNGDAGPRLALWSVAEPVSWLGQFGTCLTGRGALADHFGWVASRFRDVTEFRSDLAAVDVAGDTAYTVHLDQYLGTFDGRPETAMIHRVSRVYRREHGTWRIAHGHGDVAPWASRPQHHPDETEEAPR